MNSKYIVFMPADGNEANAFMLIFPAHKKHSDIVDYIRGGAPGLNADSAGFVQFADECTSRNICFGKSDSLNIESNRERDTLLLNRMMSN